MFDHLLHELLQYLLIYEIFVQIRFIFCEKIYF